MILISPAQAREQDGQAMEVYGVTGGRLMENAGAGVARLRSVCGGKMRLAGSTSAACVSWWGLATTAATGRWPRGTCWPTAPGCACTAFAIPGGSLAMPGRPSRACDSAWSVRQEACGPKAQAALVAPVAQPARSSSSLPTTSCAGT